MSESIAYDMALKCMTPSMCKNNGNNFSFIENDEEQNGTVYKPQARTKYEAKKKTLSQGKNVVDLEQMREASSNCIN